MTTQRRRRRMQFTKSHISTIGIVVLLLINPVANAGDGQKFGSKHNNVYNNSTQFTDYAKVVHVEPIFRQVEHFQQSQDCWFENEQHTTHYRNKRRHRRHGDHAQTIIGGIVGGAIGNQIGRHSGKKRARLGATVAGAIVGSAIASEGHSRHRWHQNNNSHTVTEDRPVKHCRPNHTKHYKQEIVGYDVTYRYGGQHHTTRMSYDPGRRVPITVSIRPQR